MSDLSKAVVPYRAPENQENNLPTPTPNPPVPTSTPLPVPRGRSTFGCVSVSVMNSNFGFGGHGHGQQHQNHLQQPQPSFGGQGQPSQAHVNHYYGSSFNFFFANQGGYDINFRGPVVQEGMGPNRQLPPGMNQSRSSDTSGYGSVHNQNQSAYGCNNHCPPHAHFSNGLGTLVRPTLTSPPPHRYGYIPSAAFPSYDLRRSQSSTSLDTTSDDYPDDLYFSSQSSRK